MMISESWDSGDGDKMKIARDIWAWHEAVYAYKEYGGLGRSD